MRQEMVIKDTKMETNYEILNIELFDDLIENNFPAILAMSLEEKTELIKNISFEYNEIISKYHFFYDQRLNIKIEITIVKDSSRENTEIFLNIFDSEDYSSSFYPLEEKLNKLKAEIFSNFL